MPGSRSNYRHLCSELVFVSRPDRPSQNMLLGNLEEIGEFFAEILTECAFPRNAEVRILSESYKLEGVVESCTFRRSLGFFVKVKLGPHSRWSERWFTPKHLLRLWSGGPPKVSPLKATSGS